MHIDNTQKTGDNYNMDYEELKKKLEDGELPQLRKLTLLADRILVLEIPTVREEMGLRIMGAGKPDRGIVVRAGKGFTDSPMGTKEGDLIIFTGMAGLTKIIDGVPLKLMRDFEILATINSGTV